MGYRLLAAALIAGLAGCSSPEQMEEAVGIEAGAQAAGDETAQEALDRQVATDAKAFAFADSEGDEKTGQREFNYAWPRQVSAIPALAEALDEQRKTELSEQERQWDDAISSCPEDFVSCRNNAFSLEWQVVADTPRFLSLSSNFYTYTGGAHGNYGRSSLVWDREAEERLDPLELFQSPAALDKALSERACAALNREREKRRGGPVEGGADDWLNACVPMTDTVVFLGSSTGAKFDRIGLYYGPYVAGSYAEGEFEFTFPVTDAILKAVKPEYREAFAAK